MSFPGLQSPAAGFDAPFELLHACHERVQRTLQLLGRLQEYLLTHPLDDNAKSAASDIKRYFDIAAPLHHEDEELHVFPVLLSEASDEIRMAVYKLQADHLHMHERWNKARTVLQYIVTAAPEHWKPLTVEQTQALTDFASLYADHIDIEEKLVYPESRQHLTTTALDAMRQDMMARRGVVAPGSSTEKT